MSILKLALRPTERTPTFRSFSTRLISALSRGMRNMEEESDAARYRMRAQRLRAIAAEDDNQENRDALERVAQEFELLARNAEAENVRGKAN